MIMEKIINPYLIETLEVFLEGHLLNTVPEH